MNKGLLAFSVLLIVVGALLGVTLIAVFGVVLLIPAFLSKSSKPAQSQTKPAPQQPRASARQSSPSPVPQPWQGQANQMNQAAAEVAVVGPPIPREVVSAGYGTNTALFPTPMFPTIGQPYPPARLLEEGKREGEKERDELFEMAVILALLRMAGA